MEIAFVLYPRFTALDLVGPYNVLAYGPGVRARLVAVTLEPVPADVGPLRILPDVTFTDCVSPDIVVVPGGPGWQRIAADGAMTGWLGSVHSGTRFTTSVCTGAFALAGAGILQGLRATTHWAAHEHLAEFGAVPTSERVVMDGKVVTAAGVSAGIDMALTLAGILWGDETAQSLQLGNEYDPQPPYRAGSPATAPAHLVDALRATLGA